LWALLLGLAAILWAEGPSKTALIVLILINVGLQLTTTPRMMLIRRVEHKRLAIVSMTISILSTTLAIIIALQGGELWALLASDIVALCVTILAFYIYRPIWRPHLMWIPSAARYFLQFGGQHFVSSALHQANDRVDDLWTRYILGPIPLGFYSRAYTFAVYPRALVADPIQGVVSGTYAELYGDRRRLSLAFFGVNAVLIRAGILTAGILFLVAPEFTRLLLGEKWLPMVSTFQLMLVFTLLDPIKKSVASVFVAVGNPGIVMRARAVQFAVLLVGLFTLGPILGIDGVAIAVNIMIVVGMTILLHRARQYVDFKARRLFIIPLFALSIGIGATYILVTNLTFIESEWWIGAIKVLTFVLTFGFFELLLERKQFIRTMSELKRLGLLEFGFAKPFASIIPINEGQTLQ
jgi:O-antigen/teichoic acid export membrane protein